MWSIHRRTKIHSPFSAQQLRRITSHDSVVPSVHGTTLSLKWPTGMWRVGFQKQSIFWMNVNVCRVPARETTQIRLKAHILVFQEILSFVPRNIIFVDEILKNVCLLHGHRIRDQSSPCTELAIDSLDSIQTVRSGEVFGIEMDSGNQFTRSFDVMSSSCCIEYPGWIFVSEWLVDIAEWT